MGCIFGVRADKENERLTNTTSSQSVIVDADFDQQKQDSCEEDASDTLGLQKQDSLIDPWWRNLEKVKQRRQTWNNNRMSHLEVKKCKRDLRKLSITMESSVDPERFSRLAERLVTDPEARIAVSRKGSEEGPVSRHGVYFCKSFSEYLENRDELITPYEVHLEEYNPKWKTEAEALIKQLGMMGCSKRWAKVEHIGSTAVVGLHAKPILDLMITIKPSEKYETAIDEFLRDQEETLLPFKIGFSTKTPLSTDDWGFFQIPRGAASEKKMSEVNVHIYVDYTKSAIEKRLFRDYLNSDEPDRRKARKEYGDVKRKLMDQINRNELSVAVYAKHKDEIVAKILKNAREKLPSYLAVPTVGDPSSSHRGHTVN